MFISSHEKDYQLPQGGVISAVLVNRSLHEPRIQKLMLCGIIQSSKTILVGQSLES